MTRSSWAAVAVALGAFATACGGGSAKPSSDAVTSSTTTSPADGEAGSVAADDSASDTDGSPDDGSNPIDEAASVVAEVMVDYHDGSRAGQLGSILEIVESAMVWTAERHRELASRLPGTFEDAELDEALGGLDDSLERVATSAEARAAEIERDRDALEVDLEESQAVLPLLEGSELGRIVARMKPAYDGVVDACQNLQRLLAGRTEILVDCVGSSLLAPPGQIEAPEGQSIEVGGVVVTFGSVDYPVRLQDNGVELGAIGKPCVWVGRPTAVSDADVGHTSPVFAEPGQPFPLNHEAPVPTTLDGLAAWLDTDGMQEMVELVGVDRTDPDGSPFDGSVTAFFRGDGAFPIVFVASEPVVGVGCDQLGWGEAVRLRVRDDVGGPIMMIVTVSAHDGAGNEIDRSAAIEALDAADQRFLGSFELAPAP